MSDRFQRIQMLAGTGRLDLAERDLRQMLAEEPRDGLAHAFLAMVLISDESRWDEAMREAKTAIGVEPDMAITHYALALCYLARNRYAEAEASVIESLRLDPYDPDAHATLSRAHLGRSNYAEALAAAEQGLAVDPEHTECGNLRSIMLERLGRGEEAIASSRANLARDPDNAMSHAAHGWTLLNNGRHQEAQVAFREALRLDPHDEMARQGLIRAMNNRSFVFRLIHRFYVAMSRLNSRAAFGLIFGAWVLMQVLSSVAGRVPILAPLIFPLLVVYVLFVVLTWIANPLFNTVLRFHPFGQHLLSRTERWASNLMAPALALAVFGLAWGWWMDSFMLGVLAGAYWIGVAIMVAAAFSMPTGQRRLLVGGAGVLVACVPIYGVVQSVLAPSFDPLFGSFQAYGYSLLAIQIGSQFVAAQPVRR
ncbi:Tetratricopeptide repeat protein [Rubripirellula lacrimiformis]|uniref:Tetratricopeptide repeat protein n=1 Tax=Rubripirellula lacrimiformis TaxID=1930273 RepID=A0A517NEZ9_9BACT|nr:tetratricopeptide repeat protein [Rubripirellula lacrimiformis]QDT05707.1 Tetratricopeptide repeat protein [Rubripirellula lacrimiformis]